MCAHPPPPAGGPAGRGGRRAEGRPAGMKSPAELGLHAADRAIGGKIGRPLLAVGSLMNESMALAVIDSVDPICVVFHVPDAIVLNLRRNPPHVRGESTLPVLVGLPDEKDLPRKTKVESADTRIDSATGDRPLAGAASKS